MINTIKNYFKKYIIDRKEKKSGSFFSSHNRPIYNKDFHKVSKKVGNPTYAIVMQGPIVEEKNFTLETVRMYKKTFPEAQIIVSTWNSEQPEYLERLRAEKVVILLNQKPDYNGLANINYQIVSSRAGMFKAKELKAEYVLKTRTDQRIYGSNVFAFLLSILDKFPPTSPKQKKRLVTSSLNTFMYRPYSISDTFLFGQIDDMTTYWNPPLDDRRFVVPKSMTSLEWAEKRWGEAYFMTNYMEGIGHTPNMTLSDTWRAYADYFCVIDQQDIDLFWLKYERQREYRHGNYSGVFLDQELSFKDWLLIYDGTYTSADADKIPINREFSTKIDNPW